MLSSINSSCFAIEKKNVCVYHYRKRENTYNLKEFVSCGWLHWEQGLEYGVGLLLLVDEDDDDDDDDDDDVYQQHECISILIEMQANGKIFD